MKLSWHDVANIGVDESVNPAEVRHIHLVNVLAIFISIFELGIIAFQYMIWACIELYPRFTQSMMALYVPYFQQAKVLLLFSTAIGILTLSAVLLNFIKFHGAARVVFGLLGLITITVNMLFLGRETLLHIYLLESIVIAFFIFPPREKGFRNTLIILFAASFIGLEIWFAHHTAIIENAPKLFLRIHIPGLLIFMVAISFYTYTIITHAEDRLQEEQKKSERLLLNILPKQIAKRLKDGSGRIADHIEEATILFADIVDFSRMSETMPANKVVSMLDEIFTEFDSIADKYGLEKIKTIGDEYMAAGGIPEPRADHCEAIANMALDIQQLILDRHQGVKLRVGIDSGSVVAGVIGQRKFIYDLWGDSVNMASRMESQSVEGKIQVTQKVYEKLKDRYHFEYRGKIEIKGKGGMVTYFLINRK